MCFCLSVCRSVRAIKRARCFKCSLGPHKPETILQLRVTSVCKITAKYIAAGFAEVATTGRKVQRSDSPFLWLEIIRIYTVGFSKIKYVYKKEKNYDTNDNFQDPCNLTLQHFVAFVSSLGLIVLLSEIQIRHHKNAMILHSFNSE